MRIASYARGDHSGLALLSGTDWLDLSAVAPDLPSDLSVLLQNPQWRAAVQSAGAKAPKMDLASVRLLPPFRTSQKILCVGLNYVDHIAESPYEQPGYPTFFPRFSSSLIGHEQPMIKPRISDQLDYEGEMVAVIGSTAKHVSVENALDHVVGYTIFNEGSIRDYQFKAPQWTIGKNFDGTGACGPWFVTADELSPGAKGLRISTRVNGKVEQDANTDDMIFDVASLVSIASEAITLLPGDMLVTGTPAGVGFGKKPPKYMVAGDVCEVEIENIGVLRNTVVLES